MKTIILNYNKKENKKREKQNPRKTSDADKKHLLTTYQRMPSLFLSSGPWPTFPQFFLVSMIACAMGYPFGQLDLLSWLHLLPALHAPSPLLAGQHAEEHELLCTAETSACY